MTNLEALLRGGAIALFLLLAWQFARGARTALPSALGLWMALGGAAYTALLAVDVAGWASSWSRVPLHLLSLSTPPAFWLFASSWFEDGFELRPRHIVFVIATVACGAAGNFLYATGATRPLILAVGWRAASLAAVLLGLRAALGGWRADLVESRRRSRLILAALVAALIAAIVLSELRLAHWPPASGWRLANAAGLAVAAAILAATLLGWRDPALLAVPVRAMPAARRAEPDDTALLERLHREMEREKLWRQDGLTVTAVAARIGVPEYRLRRAINQGAGTRNFNAFLNGFRVRETAEALADPAQRAVPILTIALDAGFGSLAPFNRAFREVYGCTPTEYRARDRSDSRNRPVEM